MRVLGIGVLATLMSAAGCAGAWADPGPPGGAGGPGPAPGGFCTGTSDDTAALKAALAALPPGGFLRLPSGKCTVTDTLVITKPIIIAGNGFGTQIYGRGNQTVFQLVGVNDAELKDLYIGSNATAAGTSLIELRNSNHNRFDNITMLGGYYGVHLAGSILNTFVDLRSGTNFGGFFAPVSLNQAWVFAEHFNAIAANSNTFVAPVLEGGVNGIYLQDQASCPGCIRGGEGSLNVVGGTIEGVAGTALTFDRTFQASSVTGVHFEKNGADVLIKDAANIKLAALDSLGGPGGSGGSGIKVTGTLNGQYTRNIQISDSIVQQIFIDSAVKRVILENITTDLQCAGAQSGTLAPFVTPPTPADPSNLYINVAHNCT